MGVGLILQAGGFVSGASTQTPAALNTIILTLSVGTLTLLAFGFVVSLRFHLDRDSHAILMAEIQRFKEQPGTRPSAENRQVVEDLTGWPYERLWGAAHPLRARKILST
jgi:oligogalacturonide transporter